MSTNENDLRGVFEGMVELGLVSTSNQWIQLATNRKDPHLTMELACSILLTYDPLDIKLAGLKGLN